MKNKQLSSGGAACPLSQQLRDANAGGLWKHKSDGLSVHDSKATMETDSPCFSSTRQTVRSHTERPRCLVTWENVLCPSVKKGNQMWEALQRADASGGCRAGRLYKHISQQWIINVRADSCSVKHWWMILCSDTKERFVHVLHSSGLRNSVTSCLHVVQCITTGWNNSYSEHTLSAELRELISRHLPQQHTKAVNWVKGQQCTHGYDWLCPPFLF